MQILGMIINDNDSCVSVLSNFYSCGVLYDRVRGVLLNLIINYLL